MDEFHACLSSSFNKVIRIDFGARLFTILCLYFFSAGVDFLCLTGGYDVIERELSFLRSLATVSRLRYNSLGIDFLDLHTRIEIAGLDALVFVPGI
ncbi:hypothetical protein HI914_06686 [Erysiphe necator]|nr:hypothetical protein HI914_06686 [Erysiphe necator]